jgi:hypothetical protein
MAAFEPKRMRMWPTVFRDTLSPRQPSWMAATAITGSTTESERSLRFASEQ